MTISSNCCMYRAKVLQCAWVCPRRLPFWFDVPSFGHHQCSECHAKLGYGRLGYTVWNLISPEDLPKLHDFLWKILGFRGPGDPINLQTIYLTPKLLRLLFDTYGVRPFRIYQYP